MRKSVWLWVLLVILAILVLGLIFGGYRKGEKLGAPDVHSGYSDSVVLPHSSAGVRLSPR
ncbi:hypothetical protein ABZ342_25200 [Amycolatopsis sp. NPDC005961]|uniref:hypothetical protein n=1 Tax=Amycolatopsis sp. NPDC005961 TaxID=3156720 RepID=UPI0033CC65AE